MSPVTRRLLALAAAAGIVAGACSGAATQAPTAATASQAAASQAAATPAASAPAAVSLLSKLPTPEPAAKTGGTIIMADWQFPDSLLAYYTQAVTSFEALYPAFDGLWRIGPDFGWYPQLTKDVPTTSNGEVVVNGGKMDVTVNMKDGMKWSDGQPITCDDVIATWKWIMDKDQVGLTGGTIGWENITGIDGAGTTTCTIHFNQVYEGYLGLIDPVLPAHYISTVSVADAPKKLYSFDNVTAGVYSGPYMPTEVKTNAQITYAPNPNWQTISGHAPYLDKVIYKYYVDAIDAMIAGYRAGEYDVAFDLDQGSIPKVQDLGDQAKISDALTYELNQLNNASLAKKFGQADVLPIKQAIRLAYDKSQITDRILGGTVKPSYNFLSPLLWYYKEEPATTQDFAQANQILDQAGWAKGSDGIRAKNGVQLALTACTTQKQSRIDTLTLVASWLQQIGIKVTVKPVPAVPDLFGSWNEVSADTPCNLQRGNYDLAEFAWSYSPDPLISYNVYHSAGIPDNPPHSGQNTTRTNIPAVDQAYDAIRTSVDPTVIKQAMGTFQDLYYQNVIEIPLFNWRELWLVSPKVHNFVVNATQYTSEWNIGDWWIE